LVHVPNTDLPRIAVPPYWACIREKCALEQRAEVGGRSIASCGSTNHVGDMLLFRCPLPITVLNSPLQSGIALELPPEPLVVVEATARSHADPFFCFVEHTRSSIPG
jgi:hypothetical protein